MNVRDLHERSAIPLRHTVCGVALLPLTVGHARLLDALALWSPSDPRETVLAAFVCSHTPERVRWWLDCRAFPWLLRFWVWRLGRGWDYARSIAAWSEFVTYHTEEPFLVPRHESRSSSQTASGTPRLAHMRVVLCSRCGYTPETFDAAPYAQASLDYLTFLEIEGQATVADFTLRQMRQLQRQ